MDKTQRRQEWLGHTMKLKYDQAVAFKELDIIPLALFSG